MSHSEILLPGEVGWETCATCMPRYHFY